MEHTDSLKNIMGNYITTEELEQNPKGYCFTCNKVCSEQSSCGHKRCERCGFAGRHRYEQIAESYFEPICCGKIIKIY